MKTTLMCVGGCLLAGSLIWTARIGGQQPKPMDAPSPASSPYNTPPLEPTAPAVSTVVPPKPATKNIDQLLDTLENIRKQKAELDKQEKAVIEELKQKLKAQHERLQLIGVNENEREVKKEPERDAKKDPEILILPPSANPDLVPKK